MKFAIITLLSGLSLSAVAEYFSIIGLLAIFPAAFWSILSLGVCMGVAKIVATIWLKREWNNSPILVKLYLLMAVIILMIITAIGGYGFLTKSHLDQGGSTIDNSAKVERLEQQIAREKSIITDDEKVITQLDATINSYIGKDRTDKSLAVRRSQSPQRKQLRDDIDASQKRIDGFSDERLKLQSEVRKLQLDVGPLRYIAELFYGVADDATRNIEAAVRIFTLLITSTLDPLAVILLIAANHTLLRIRDEKEKTPSTSKQYRDNSASVESGSSTETNKEQSEDNKANTETVKSGSIVPPMENWVERNCQPEDAISLSVLPETVETLNEKETGNNNTLEEDQNILQVFPSNTSTMSEPNETIIDRSAEAEAAETVQEVDYEEEKTILEIISSPGLSLPIIRSPNLTRIQLGSTDVLGPTPIPPASLGTTVETEIHIPERMAISEVIPHFIPQKLHEEKFTQLEDETSHKEVADPTPMEPFSIRAGTGDRPQAQGPTHEVETVYEASSDNSEITSEVEGFTDDSQNDSIISDTTAKYPTALSWLAEFKRSKHG